MTGPLGAAFVTGLSDAQILALEELAEEYMIEILNQVAEHYADLMLERAGLTAAADDLPPPGVSPEDFAGVPAAVDGAIAETIAPLVAEVYLSAQSQLRAQLIRDANVTLPPVFSIDAADYLRNAPPIFADVGDDLWAAMRSELAVGFEAGEGIPELAARVRAAGGVTARKATLLARTSVVAAANSGSYDMAKASGLLMLKEWLATPDARTRPSHREADGQRVDLHAKFTVGGYPADRPGDYTLPDAEKLSCRCTLGYVTTRDIDQRIDESNAAIERAGERFRAADEAIARQDEILNRPSPTDDVRPVSRFGDSVLWGTSADPAMKMTVTQLRELAAANAVPNSLWRGQPKAGIVSGIRTWEANNARTILPDIPPQSAPASVARSSAFRATFDAGDTANPITGKIQTHWSANRPDTGPNGIAVRDAVIEGSYVIAQGRAWVIDGIGYLIEIPSGPITARMRADVLRTLTALREQHETLPGASLYNKSYNYILRANPHDIHYAQQYGVPDFASAATAGDGSVTFWRMTRPAGYRPSDDTFRHETGHNLDYRYATHHGLGSANLRWSQAVGLDTKRWSADPPPIIDFVGRERSSAFELLPKRDSSAQFPNGVTKYGKTHAAEDYAESFELYTRRSPIAEGTINGERVPLYFRDVWPNRAALFDEMFPDFAKAQIATIKASRSSKVVIAKVAKNKEVRDAARARQVFIDKSVSAESRLADIDELLYTKADVGVIETGLSEALAQGALARVDVEAIRRALLTGNETKIRAAVDKVAKKYKITHDYRAGEIIAMPDPSELRVRAMGGDWPPVGTPVRVVRRGSSVTYGTEAIRLEPALVRKVAPDEIARIRQVKVDDASKVANAVAQLRRELDAGPVSGARVGQIADRNNLPVGMRQALVKAAATPDALKRAVAAQMKAAGIKAQGVVNRAVDFDADTMELRGAATAVPEGKVKIVETGYVAEIDGRPVVIRKAVVEPIAPKAPKKAATPKAAPAKKAAPRRA